MTRSNFGVYPSAIAELVREIPLAPLGPGDQVRSCAQRLTAINNHQIGATIVDHDMAACCRSGLWLAYGFLEESHEISQTINSIEGSYWHALMHRREPDHSNAAYWFRRVGRHPIFAELAQAATDLGYMNAGATWDPFTFNDHCERSRNQSDSTVELLRHVQQAEWRILFDYCFRHATG